MWQSPSWWANRFSASQFPAFYGTQRFITMFTRACHLSLLWVRSIQSMPFTPLPEDLCCYYPPIYAWVFQAVSFHQASAPKPCMHHSSPPHVLHAPTHFILLNLIIWIIFGEEYRSWSSSICSFLHSPVSSSLFGPNILRSTLFSKALSLCSCLNVSDQYWIWYQF